MAIAGTMYLPGRNPSQFGSDELGWECSPHERLSKLFQPRRPFTRIQAAYNKQIPMDRIGEIILRLKIRELEAQLALREIEREALNRKIDDPDTDTLQRYEAELRRDQSLIEWGEIMTALQKLREIHAAKPARLNTLNKWAQSSH